MQAHQLWMLSQWHSGRLCAQDGRSRPPRRRSNADVRPSVAVVAQMSPAGEAAVAPNVAAEMPVKKVLNDAPTETATPSTPSTRLNHRYVG